VDGVPFEEQESKSRKEELQQEGVRNLQVPSISPFIVFLTPLKAGKCVENDFGGTGCEMRLS